MKKHGFTLSEVLIALGIIGIISAIGLPLINNARPDKNKVTYLKAYDSLNEVVRSITSTSSLYNVTYISSARQYDAESGKIEEKDNVRYSIEKFPLLDYGMPINPGYRTAAYRAGNKLCNLIMDGFSATKVHDCGTNGEFGDSYNFVTNNSNTWWKISPSAQSLEVSQSGTNLNRTAGDVVYANLVEVDINGEEEPNSFNGTVQNPPDRFKFYITANGNVTPADVFGQAYLVNRKSLQKSKLSLKDPATDKDFTEKGLNDITDATIAIGTDIKADVIEELDPKNIPQKDIEDFEGENNGHDVVFVQNKDD